MIVIVDYNTGNPGSIRNMLRKIGHDSEISCDPARIAEASKLVLPGVGAFDAGMECLERTGLIPLLNDRVINAKVPVLGICLGMQLMTHGSEEGKRPGLGWIDAETVRFRPQDPSLKVPHMGWNQVQPGRPSPLLEGMENARFYFVHSYFVRCRSEDDVLLSAVYGGAFHAAFEHGNVRGVQFHPEKSHKFGMQLLSNFAERC
ncbi:MAG TPA: imidazole glycerol phosphate synthase subunit HisH [Noviherbaspirillum sp.]|jgi:glutamine amidotransferase|uniref:imidazole glycerol phosphate synthase subunit HisH n=1 Tax=Noviherbaspirillum sp. TaxID=1926288 RepID=UPI002F95E958